MSEEGRPSSEQGRSVYPQGGARSATEVMPDDTRPADEQPQESPQEQSQTGKIKSYAEASASLLGTAALVGAGLDSVWDILPYADPQQWIVAGLVLVAIGAGRQIPSLIGGK